MAATTAILANDARGVMRDNVMMLNVGLSFVGMVAITVVGHFKGDTDWAQWFPFLVIFALLTGPPGYGFLFGLLMVDERDTGVRSALAVTPVPPLQLLVVRSMTSVVLMIVWPLITVYVMNSTWRALEVPPGQVIALVSTLALMAPVTALGVAAFASNKVEALAIFKGINFVVLAPLALYFLPPDVAYRSAFLLSPAGWAVFGFDSFNAGDAGAGYLYLAGGAVYHLLLLGVALRVYLSTLYKTDA